MTFSLISIETAKYILFDVIAEPQYSHEKSYLIMGFYFDEYNDSFFTWEFEISDKWPFSVLFF